MTFSRTCGRVAATVLATASLITGVAHAATAKQELGRQETFTAEDADKAQVYVNAAMTTPMLDLLSRADVSKPDVMLEYGLALELGRPTASAQLSTEDKEKLKRGFRDMLDLYLNSSDKFGNVTFKEDSMLDVPEFWIILAEHIGRPKQRVDVQAAIDATGGNAGGALPVFIPDVSEQDKEFNLNSDLILRRAVVNAATTCADSAMGFARMKKVQMLDISATKATPEQFKQAHDIAVTNYRLAYQEGSLGCGSHETFLRIAAFAGQNLGRFGDLKEDPNAKLVDLASAPAKP